MIISEGKTKINFGGDTVSIEEKKKEISEVVEVLSELSRDDLMQAFGFALGLKAKENAASIVTASQPG